MTHLFCTIKYLEAPKKRKCPIIQINHTDITFFYLKPPQKHFSTYFHQLPLTTEIANCVLAERCSFPTLQCKKSLKPENYFPVFTWAGAILTVDTVSRSTSSLFSWKKTLQFQYIPSLLKIVWIEVHFPILPLYVSIWEDSISTESPLTWIGVSESSAVAAMSTSVASSISWKDQKR